MATDTVKLLSVTGDCSCSDVDYSRLEKIIDSVSDYYYLLFLVDLPRSVFLRIFVAGTYLLVA